ncbi:MAG: hypothetical protein IH585_09150 [Anaerolineaceae bacterium]|nr:hypothetical protein [Anaerolineaceae bacterium]
MSTQQTKKAVMTLTMSGYIPSERVVTRAIQMAIMPESRGYDIRSIDSVGDIVFGKSDIKTALTRNNIDLAIFPKENLIFFNPSAFNSLLQLDSSLGEYKDWESLVYSFVINNFRLAVISISGEKVGLDIHQLSPKSFDQALRDTNTPRKNRESFYLSIILILAMDIFTWMGWGKLTGGWQIYAMIGVVLIISLNIFLSGKELGLRLVWVILTAIFVFFSFITVLIFKGFL